MARMAILVGLLVGLALSNSALAQEKTKDSPQKEAPKAKAAPKITGPAPTYADVHYGDHARQVVDFWKAKSEHHRNNCQFGRIKGKPCRLQRCEFKC